MKIISSLFILFSLLSFAQSRNELPEFKISGLLSHQGMSMTVYLVSSANSIIGAKKQINRVFQVLDQRIIVEGEVDLKPVLTSRSSFGIKPNAVVVVVHSQKTHALNKHDSNPNAVVQFSEPKYSNSKDRVEATDSNKVFIKRVTVPLTELEKEQLIKL